jgi:hypothetical protein
LRARWQEMLTGGDNQDTSNPLVASYIGDVNTRATQIWNSMIKKPASGDDNRTCLFPDLPITERNNTGSSQITLTYDRLRSLTLAYKMPGSSFTGNQEVYAELIAALDLMVTKHYSLTQSTTGTGTAANGGSYGNWYDWRIGTPLRYGDLLVMISDELTSAQMTTYVAPILSNNQSVDLTGANKTWVAGIVAQAGVLTGDAAQIAKAKTGLQSIFPYVTSGDGYYADGSFVQHSNYAYTGGYGKALLATIAPLMYVLKGSTWEITYSNKIEQNFYNMIFEAYEPLIYDGRFMDLAREREISRVANQDHVPGRQAIRAIVLLLDVLEGDQKVRAEQMLKEWLLDEVVMQQVCSDPLEGFLEYYLPPFVISKAQELLDDETITPRGKLITNKTFASMDRVVHLQEDYALGLAMSSTRIKNTEGTNNEGLRFWHIADGMTYLYNEDKDLFADHFWATVDYQRLPGTTVARVNRGTKDGYGTNNPSAWVGGADMDAYGVAGMWFTGLGTSTTRTLQARKSWFMFDDEIVATGSGIKLGSGSAPVETIIENRKIKPDFSNKLILNGSEQEVSLGSGGTTEENKSLQVTTVSSASTNVVARYTLNPSTNASTVVVEYSVSLPLIANYMAVKIYGRGDGDTADKVLNFASMRESYLAQRLNATGTAQDACSPLAILSAGKWHRVKIELNLTNGTYNYYFDGEQVQQTSAISGVNYSVAANLVDHTFPESIGANGKVTAIEVFTPNGGSGAIRIDNIKVSEGSDVLYEEDFETFLETSSIDSQAGWTVTKTDNGAGAGAIINKETATYTDFSDEFTGAHTDVEWIHLEGNQGANTDVGYYFPGKATVDGLREARTGAWNLVNTYAKFTDATPRANNFATFWINHGNSPQDESYAYVLLPGKSAEETEAYNETPDVEILQQDSEAHAVRENTLDITAINFWTAGTSGPYTVNQPAALLVQNNPDGTANIALSHPSRTATIIQLTFDRSIVVLQEALELDDKVAFQPADNRLAFNVASAYGKTFRATVRTTQGSGIDVPGTYDPVVKTEYYNLMGQKVERPTVSGVYLIKETLQSKKIRTTKRIINIKK